MTTVHDPLVSALGSLSRWHRCRQLTLAPLVGAALFSFASVIDIRPIPEETVIGFEPSVWPPHHVPVSPEQAWADAPLTLERFEQPTLEPRIERRYGSWLARDVMGVEQIDLGVVGDPASVESALRDWAARICEANPRPLYLFGFEDLETIDELARILVDACPSLLVYRVRFRYLPEY